MPECYFAALHSHVLFKSSNNARIQLRHKVLNLLRHALLSKVVIFLYINHSFNTFFYTQYHKIHRTLTLS